MKLQSLSLTVHNLAKRKPNKRSQAGEFINLMSTNYNLTAKRGNCVRRDGRNGVNSVTRHVSQQCEESS